MAYSNAGPGAIEDLLGEELAVADRAQANTGPILRHLLANDDQSVFSDEIIARVRGMMMDLARQLIVALAEVAGHEEPQAWAHEASEDLGTAFLGVPALLAHAHALALEWHVAERLHVRLALDPVLSPLLQTMIASQDPATAASAMKLLAAQARFGQSVRRMQLPLNELPGDLFHIVMLTMRSYLGDTPDADAQAHQAELALRARQDGRNSRIALMDGLIRGMGGQAEGALAIDNAGVSLFATGLAIGSGLDRDTAVFAMTESQLARLVLALSASGLKSEAITAQFVTLHPEITLPKGLEHLRADRAAALLARFGEALAH
ncbi:hypothetical protein [Novosphingobium lentum]|uniref:hypothetical protein n=1 Tax=Novosphingobium lentum TaxID=145287 RepID=UPI00083170B0|nr:hypothetical protein [Novosphingobium lentum]